MKRTTEIFGEDRKLLTGLIAKVVLPLTLVVLASGFLSYETFSVLEQRSTDSLNKLVDQYAKSSADLMESNITDRLLALDRMASRFQGSTPEEFLTWKDDAENYYQNYGSFLSLQWADKSSRVQWVHPLKGNEGIIGLTLDREGDRNKALEYAMNTKKGSLTKPINLVQGGVGFISLHPTFDPNRDVSGYILGVYLASELMASVSDKNSGFKLAVVWDGKEVFTHNEAPQSDFARTIDLSIRNESLKVVVSPTQELINTFVGNTQHYLTAILTFLIILILSVFLIVQRRMNSLVRRKNEELAESMAIRSRFLANMSHEIRTPLNGVLGMATLLRNNILGFSDKKQSASALRKLSIIENSGETLLRIIDDILDFSKLEEGQISLENVPFDPSHLIRDTCEMLRARAVVKGLKLKTNFLGDHESGVIGDPTRIRQILTNFLGNAIKFTEHGFVQVDWSVKQRLDQWFLEISVIDSGIGMTEGEMESLFEPFSQADISTTRKFGGSGLGLSICKNIAELMEGTISVESSKGRGSKFHFAVPVMVSAQEGQKERYLIAELDQADLHGARILVAEDSSINAEIIEGMLESFQLDFKIVSNGREVLDSVDHESFDIILMDCQMPVMDGLEATQQIIKKYDGHRPKIVALTASAMKEEKEACFAAGMDDFISKPLRARELHAAIKRNMAR